MSCVWRLYWRSSRGMKLYAKSSKCEFWLGKVTFWGQILSKEEISVDSSKAEAVSQWQQPGNFAKVQSFLGLAGCYQRFVNEFSKIATLMTAFTHKNVKFEWTEACEQNSKELKR